jgi:uncharacterized OsmC-like protein
MLSTVVGALEAHRIDASGERLTADVSGEVEKEEGVLVIRRINVAMRLRASEQSRETAERVHGLCAMRCPLYHTLHKAIQLTSSCMLVPPSASLQDFPPPRAHRTGLSRPVPGTACSTY